MDSPRPNSQTQVRRTGRTFLIPIQTLHRSTTLPRTQRAPKHPLLPARWVWAPQTERSNQFVVFARALPATKAPIRVRICASQAYELYLDGQFIGRGPVTGSDEWRLFDEYLWSPDAQSSAQSIEVAIVALHETPAPAAVWPIEAGVIAAFEGDNWKLAPTIAGAVWNWNRGAQPRPGAAARWDFARITTPRARPTVGTRKFSPPRIGLSPSKSRRQTSSCSRAQRLIWSVILSHHKVFGHGARAQAAPTNSAKSRAFAMTNRSKG